MRASTSPQSAASPMDEPRSSAVSGPEPGSSATPTTAGIYDELCGGSHNFGPDQDAARRLRTWLPDPDGDARANRAFLHRAVRRLTGLGVTQFLDLGCGLPLGGGSVHRTARAIDSAARVVYVDSNPTVTAYLGDLLTDTPGVSVMREDLRDEPAVMGSAAVLDVLDLGRPVAVLATSVLHFLADHDDPAGLMTAYRDALAPGSYLVISHATPAGLTDWQIEAVTALYATTGTPITFRTPDQITELFPGFALFAPHLDAPARVVPVSAWQSMDEFNEPSPATMVHGGVGFLCPPFGPL